MDRGDKLDSQADFLELLNTEIVKDSEKNSISSQSQEVGNFPIAEFCWNNCLWMIYSSEAISCVALVHSVQK